MIKYIFMILVLIIFNGCVVGDTIALPFRVTGAVVNVVAPDVVGDTISTTGNSIDTAIPF
ncbi:DUF6726 family protein [Halarcobacter sp.]|uniref:DUF6726 family protein n=1 Tax=Halarcobacter sp. TaxID=2321133 RepID=UPI002AA82B09|nr:DUF6726 family protein [Halarcobacter sp.]